MSEQVRIATFNVRYLSVFDFLSSNRWSKRKEYINEFINELGADIIGMQEVTPKHREHFRTLSKYKSIGKHRNGGTSGEACAIYYRPDVVDFDVGGTFWISDTPLREGSKLGPGHPRVVTWACFKKGDVSFYHFNTHLSVMSNQIREKSTRIILSEKRKILGNGSPCILTGDFNATPDSQVMTTLKEAFPIDVYRRVNLIQSSEEGTRHGFNGNSTGDRIDWILTNIPIKPINCSIVRERMRNDRFPSDHFPVIADLVIPERAIGVR